MPKPLAIDLYCGLGGWTDGLLAEGWDVIGFDIEHHDYGTGGYPAQLVLMDCRQIHGAMFKDASLIVASSPCQEFSYRAMPWKRAKALPPPLLGTNLFWQCWRIQQEAIEATRRYCGSCLGFGKNCLACRGKGYHERYVPMVVENVKGAQKWIGRAKGRYGSFFLWGDVESVGGRLVRSGPVEFGMASVRPLSRVAKLPAHINEAIRNGHSPVRWTNPAENLKRLYADRDTEGTKQHGSGPEWWRTGNGATSSKSSARKAASAQIAKIPFPLSSFIGRVFYPSK